MYSTELTNYSNILFFSKRICRICALNDHQAQRIKSNENTDDRPDLRCLCVTVVS